MVQDQLEYILKVSATSASDAGRYALELKSILSSRIRDIHVQPRRDESFNQDFGSTLVLILGTPAVLAAAKAIGDWLKLRYSASLIIEKDGKVVATNITSRDVLRLAEIFLEKPEKTSTTSETFRLQPEKQREDE